MGSQWRSSRDPQPPPRPVRAFAAALPAFLALLLGAATWGTVAAAEQASDSCIACHSNPELMVTNKKLYDYYQRWRSSIHEQEGVSCDDCHGGNPAVSDKQGAHGGDLGEAGVKSAVNFRNIPSTCGECHSEIFEGFRKSEHYQHVAKEQKKGQQGPTCVTCHGSINVAVLNVTTVEEICQQCHNDESGNHPENPRKARSLLNRFLSIHRYYRYITVRGDPAETKPFFEQIDAELRDLTTTWHSFDLEAIEKQTEVVLSELKAKREEVAKTYKKDLEKQRRTSD